MTKFVTLTSGYSAPAIVVSGNEVITVKAVDDLYLAYNSGTIEKDLGYLTDLLYSVLASSFHYATINDWVSKQSIDKIRKDFLLEFLNPGKERNTPSTWKVLLSFDKKTLVPVDVLEKELFNGSLKRVKSLLEDYMLIPGGVGKLIGYMDTIFGKGAFRNEKTILI